MEGLSSLDKVVYVRFASVYKNFKEAKDFEEFVGNLDEINHSFFSNLVFNLAEKHLGQTKKNPSVGCIVVKENSVISSGVTSINGRPHAEFNALSKKLDFKNSTMYVTLEPCTHYLRRLVKNNKRKKINKVYFCEEDPDKRVYKKAKKALNKNKIFAKKLI